MSIRLGPVSCFVAAVLAAFAAAGCCCCSLDLFKLPDLSDLVSETETEPEPTPAPEDPKKAKKRKQQRPQPKPQAGAGDLGQASFPPDASTAPAVHEWQVLRPRLAKHQLSYALGEQASRGLQREYDSFARQVHHVRLGPNKFRWQPPARCRNSGLQCVYEALESQGRASIQPLAELFERRMNEAKLSPAEVAGLVVSFVQHVRYEIPGKQPFGVLPPALVVSEKRGDCDSKALLAHMILRRLGLDSVLISSEAHQHTMLGLALTAPGSSFTYQGRRYAFVEVTAKHSPIGHINPTLLKPSDWRAIPLRQVSSTGSSAAAAPVNGRPSRLRIRN